MNNLLNLEHIKLIIWFIKIYQYLLCVYLFKKTDIHIKILLKKNKNQKILLAIFSIDSYERKENYILSHINKNSDRFDLLNKLNSSINDSSTHLRFFVVSSAIHYDNTSHSSMDAKKKKKLFANNSKYWRNHFF